MRIVKSAARTLDILEYFATTRAPASVSDVERALGLPQSSTSVLLHTLVALGYLEQLAGGRKFRPTARVAVLGDWIGRGPLDGSLTKQLDSLQRLTRESVILGRRQNALVQFVYVRLADRNRQAVIRRGSTEPICLSAVGRALLSTLPSPTVRQILRRNNADAAAASDRVSEDVLFQALDVVRQTGISETVTAIGRPRHVHVIATLLPLEAGSEQMAVGIAGPGPRMYENRDEIVSILKHWLAHGKPGPERDSSDVEEHPTGDWRPVRRAPSHQRARRG